MTPPPEPVDLTPPEFADLPVTRATAANLDQVAAMVAVHDGASRAEIALEGTNFRVTLGPRRPLVHTFSERDMRRLSDTQRAELMAKWDKDLFEGARDWAVRELRALPKQVRRRVHPPRQVVPAAGEVSQLRRDLVDARRITAAVRGDLEAVRQELEGSRAKVRDLTDAVRMLTAAAESQPMDDDTEEKALFLIYNWEDLPLEALRWVVEENRRP